VFAAKLKERIDEGVREAIFRALAGFHHQENPDVLALFLDHLPRFDRSKKFAGSTQFLFIGIGGMSPKLTRPHVGKVHEWVGHRDASLAAHAVRALAKIRHKSSVPILIERLKKVQKDVRPFVKGDDINPCDGD
jgi:hypothetical protein